MKFNPIKTIFLSLSISRADLVELTARQTDACCSLITFAFESFGPFDQFSDGQSLLLAREAEREPEWQDLFVDSARFSELCQALGNVVEELVPMSGHQLLADGEHLGVHVESVEENKKYLNTY